MNIPQVTRRHDPERHCLMREQIVTRTVGVILGELFPFYIFMKYIPVADILLLPLGIQLRSPSRNGRVFFGNQHLLCTVFVIPGLWLKAALFQVDTVRLWQRLFQILNFSSCGRITAVFWLSLVEKQWILFWYSGWESFSDQRREISRETLLHLFIIWRGYKRAGEEFLTRPCTERRRVNGFKLKEGQFRLDMREKFFTMSVRKTTTGCPERWWIPNPWKTSRTGLWLSWECHCSWQGGWTGWPLKGPFNSTILISWFCLVTSCAMLVHKIRSPKSWGNWWALKELKSTVKIDMFKG